MEQPERSLYELEPGEWRDYDAYVGHPGRTPAGMHVATFDQRIAEWRQRFLTEAASAIGQRVSEFGWHRVPLAGDRQVTDGFADQLADTVRERVIGVVNANVLWEEPAAVADRFENALDEAWRRDTHMIIDRAIEAALAGGRGRLDGQKCSIAWCNTASSISFLPLTPPQTPRHYRRTSAMRWVSLRPAWSWNAPSSTRSHPAPGLLPCPTRLDDCLRSGRGRHAAILTREASYASLCLPSVGNPTRLKLASRSR